LFENKSVYKNIEYAFKVLKIKKPYEADIKELLNKFGLDGKEKIKVKKLCYIDRLKTCLARSYLKNANVLLVDDLFKNATTEEEIESIWHAFNLLDLGNKTLIMVLNKEIKPQIDFDYTLKIDGKKIVEENNK